MQILDVLSRILHVGTAVVLVGGSVFLRFVLMPAAAGLPEAEHQALRERLMARWRRFVGAGIGLFLLSGFWNYLAVTAPLHKGDRLYHPLVGTKILLALVVFFLASALSGRSPAFEGLRRSARTWLAVTIVLAGTIVAISGFLKVRGVPAPAVTEPAPTLRPDGS